MDVVSVLATDYYTATGGMQAYTTSGFLRAEVYSVSDTPNFISFCTNDTASVVLWYISFYQYGCLIVRNESRSAVFSGETGN